MALNFDTSGQLKAPFGMKYDQQGRVIILARAHDTLVAGTPYRIKVDEYGYFTAAPAANQVDTYRVGIAKKAYVADAIAELVHGGPYSGMITVSLSVSVGHSFGITAGAVVDNTVDYDDAMDNSFGVCYTASSESTTQDVVMVPELMTAAS